MKRLLFFLLIILSFFCAAGYGAVKFFKSGVFHYKNSMGNIGYQSPQNILVVGVDRTSSVNGVKRSGPWRADALVFIRMYPKTGRLFCLHIPRNTVVYIPGYGMKTIANSYVYGGLPLAVATVEELLGMRVDHAASLDYVAFEHMVDTVGGVEINVEKELRTKWYHFEPGRQHMDGRQAYVYVTSREDPDGDFNRIERQKQLLVSLYLKLRKEKKLINYAKLYLELKKKCIGTTLSTDESVKLTLMMRNGNFDKIDMATLPVKCQSNKEAELLFVDHLAWRGLKREKLSL